MRRNIRNSTCLFLLSSLTLVAYHRVQAAEPGPIYLSEKDDPQCFELCLKVLQGQVIDESIEPLGACQKTETRYTHYGSVRGRTKSVLHQLGRKAVPALVEALDGSDQGNSRCAIIELGMMGPLAGEALPALRDRLRKTGRQRHLNNDVLPALVAVAIGSNGDVDFLVRIMQGKETEIMPSYGARGLGAAGAFATPVLPELVKALQSSDQSLAYYAVEALGEIGPAANSVVPQLVEMRSNLKDLPFAVEEALKRIGTPEALAAARLYREDADRLVRKMKKQQFFDY